MNHDYDPKLVEPKWQEYWAKNQVFKTSEDFSKPKYYVLDMFPYPSGSGLHVGHPEGYTATDIIARYKRMEGFNVLHPMGWDAFGLPAERAALREDLHPAIITKRNIANFKQQIYRLGLSYDWDREICTSDPNYYKWTQWIFLKMYEKGLAYLADVAVNWCPAQGTVLANEEVLDGKYIETGDLVEKKIMKQWILKITDYAERLLADLEGLDWPANVIEIQKNWIGRSEGAKINFKVEKEDLTVFTTCPETIYGVSFCVLAPDHPLLNKICSMPNREQVANYCDNVRGLSAREKEVNAAKQKTGVDTGVLALNPLTNQLIPVWVADYVKLDYGAGAVMGVPGHDERDREFAQCYNLPVFQVIDPDSKMINSDLLNGMEVTAARRKVISLIQELGCGTATVTYKLRDWLFSRQRYWGEPFPLVYSNNKIIPLSEDELPLTLPELAEFKPTPDGEPPLARANDWKTYQRGNVLVSRELNTMPQWAGSCWYYLRYLDPKNDNLPFDPSKERYWGQVDLYVGGLEHAVSHLLYARFWHKVLFDCGLVSHNEPFKKLFNQGIILGVSYRDQSGKYYHVDEVLNQEGQYFSKKDHKPLTSMVEKMSKSKLNITNPDDIIMQYGADPLRLYEMFLGPLEAAKPWQTNGVKGVYNFLQRIWRFGVDLSTGKLSANISAAIPEDLDLMVAKELHITIAKVTKDIVNLKFNTAIAKMMECFNVFKTRTEISQAIWEKFILILSPFAPHIAEELWEKLGHNSLAYHPWPKYDPQYLVDDLVPMICCINGKKIQEFQVTQNLSESALMQLIKQDPKIIAKLADREIIKTIIVPNKTINVIVK